MPDVREGARDDWIGAKHRSQKLTPDTEGALPKASGRLTLVNADLGRAHWATIFVIAPAEEIRAKHHDARPIFIPRHVPFRLRHRAFMVARWPSPGNWHALRSVLKRRDLQPKIERRPRLLHFGRCETCQGALSLVNRRSRRANEPQQSSSCPSEKLRSAPARARNAPPRCIGRKALAYRKAAPFRPCRRAPPHGSYRPAHGSDATPR